MKTEAARPPAPRILVDAKPKASQVPLPAERIPGPEVKSNSGSGSMYNHDNHDYIKRLHEQYGDIVALRLTSAARHDTSSIAKKLVVFVRDSETVRRVLHSDDTFAKTWDAAGQSSERVDYVHNLIQPMLSGTVFNNVADRGRPGVHGGRQLLRPTFGSYNNFVGGFEAQVDRALTDGVPWVGSMVDVQRLAHDVMRRTLFVAVVGQKMADEASRLSESVFHEAMSYFAERYADPEHSAEVSAADTVTMKRMHATALGIVSRWRELGGLELDGEDQGCSMLHSMEKSKFGDEHMASMLVNTIIAGAEAPASALAATIEHLSRDPALQVRERGLGFAMAWPH